MVFLIKKSYNPPPFPSKTTTTPPIVVSPYCLYAKYLKKLFWKMSKTAGFKTAIIHQKESTVQ